MSSRVPFFLFAATSDVYSSHGAPPTPMPTLSIRHLNAVRRPALFVRLRLARHEVPLEVPKTLLNVYALAQPLGLAGQPFVRYIDIGFGLLTLEVGFPLLEPASGAEDISAGFLDGGPVAVAIHAGPYQDLGQTHAALQRWIEANGFRPSGAPWDTYVTDPQAVPDPADWRTEVCWPVVTTSHQTA
jgi:effector-binding domain-containing protein